MSCCAQHAMWCVVCACACACVRRPTVQGINTQQLGYLQSSFMVGYAASCLVVAQLVHYVKPFKIIGVCLWIWMLAVCCSGFANFLCQQEQEGLDHPGEKICDAYYLLLFGRIFSGVGEASIAAISVPFIDDMIEPVTHR